MSNPYINVWDWIQAEDVFCPMLGGRGCGKTDSALRGVIGIDCPYKFNKFIYMRRTETELKQAVNSYVNPFGEINIRYGVNITVYADKVLSFKRDDNVIGYATALTTMKNLRGITLPDVDVIVYDEFIPEMHAKPIKGEAMALFNAYETINRNREFVGKPPVKLILLANIFNIYSAILSELGLINQVYEMQLAGGTQSIVYPDRLLRLTVFDEQEFVKAKQQTAIGKLTADGKYEQIAITQRVKDCAICKMNLREFRAIWNMGGVTLWQHKDDITQLYVTESPNYTPATESDLLSRAKTVDISASVGNIYFASAEAKYKLHSLYPKIIKNERW